MRNSKVKTLKKTALFTLSLLLISAGAALAQTWSDVENSAATGTATLTNDVTATSTLTPPVPFTLNGGGHKITGSGTEGSIIDSTQDGIVNINNVQIVNGIKTGNTASKEYGGAAIHNVSNLTIDGGEYTNNSASNGGAIMNAGTVNSNGVLTVKNATFNSNSAVAKNSAGFGGAIANFSAAPGTTLTVEGSTFNNNSVHKIGEGSGGFGGAIHHGSGNAIVKNSTFTNNTANQGGGAISSWSNMTISGSTFDKNSITNSYGGAIINGSTASEAVSNATLDISNTTFTENGAVAGGGAIYNRPSATSTLHTVNINEGTSFKNNYVNTSGISVGGAIANDAAGSNDRRDAVLNVKGTSSNKILFEGNVAANGGAVWNKGNADIDYAKFTGNGVGTSGTASAGYKTLNGGAIYNSINQFTDASNNIKFSTGKTSVKNSDFDGNKATTNGGAIFNEGDVTVSNSTFTNNTAKHGGAIYNQYFENATAQRYGTLNVTNGTFNNNSASTNGGAIHNSAVAIIQNSTFDNNTANTYGGAIYNVTNKAALISDSVLTNNKANFNGGGLYNGSKEFTVVSNTTFKGNSAKFNGGAIYNRGLLLLDDPVIERNSAEQQGGGIYTSTQTNDIDAVTAINITKDGNIGYWNSATDNSAVNNHDSIILDVTKAGEIGLDDKFAMVELEVADGKTLNIYSKVDSTENTPVENAFVTINYDENSTGEVAFRKDASIKNTSIEINRGTVSFEHDAGLDGSNILIMNGGTLSLYNGEFYNQFRPTQFYLDKTSHVIVDVDLANQVMDGFYEDLDNPNFFVKPGENLIIDKMYAKGDAPNGEANIQFTNSPALQGSVVDSTPVGGEVQGSVYKYTVTQYDVKDQLDPEKNGVYFGFKQIGASDPAQSGPAAQIAAFLMMDNLYRQSFANMDMVALLTPDQREMLKALQGGNRIDFKRAKGYHTGVFAPNTVPEERDGIYVRPFANFESIPLKNGPKVSNVFYGSLIGGESDLIDLGHGWDGTFSLFGAYQGSHQAYSGVDVWQNGGTLGAVGTVYKGRFFSGLTANVGASAAEIRHGFGNDDFPVLMTGAAWKSGYNLGMFSNKLILQPSYMMSYTFVNVFDYTSSSGARITHDPLNVLEIVPGIRLIGNFKNGWQPYIGANMTWNIMDKTKFYADNIMLPQLSIKPFVEYGVGLQKRYGDRFTGYGQAMFRSGGRNGVAFTLGLRWALGN